MRDAFFENSSSLLSDNACHINASATIFARHHITLKRSNFLLIYLRKRVHLLFHFIRTLLVLQFGGFDYNLNGDFVFFDFCALHTANQKLKHSAKGKRVQIKIKKKTEENNTAAILQHIQCGTHIAVNQFIPHEN